MNLHLYLRMDFDFNLVDGFLSPAQRTNKYFAILVSIQVPYAKLILSLMSRKCLHFFAHGQCNSSCALIASNIQTQTQRGGDHFSTVIKILKTFVFFPENVNGFVKTRKTFSNRVKHHYTPAAV